MEAEKMGEARIPENISAERWKQILAAIPEATHIPNEAEVLANPERGQTFEELIAELERAI